MARTKTNTRNDTKFLQHHDATDIYTNYIFVFFGFFFFYFLFTDNFLNELN